jgi:hypothetical protein
LSKTKIDYISERIKKLNVEEVNPDHEDTFYHEEIRTHENNMLHGGNQYYYEPEKAWENKEKKTYRIYHRNLFVAKSIKEAKYVWTVWNTSRYPY